MDPDPNPGGKQNVDLADPDPVPDPQHWYLSGFYLVNMDRMSNSKAHLILPICRLC
jgi:hypothetical protein